MRNKKAPSQRLNFTRRSLEALRPPAEGERTIVYDTQKAGLGLLILPSGTKTYFHFRRVKGKPTRTTIGRFDEKTIEQARGVADKLNGALATWKQSGYAGANPFGQREANGASVPPFEQLVEAYIRRHVREEANKADKAEYAVRWIVRKHFSAWLERRIDRITVEDVQAVKNACGEHRHQANRCVEFVRAIFNWSHKSKDGKVNFWRVENPARDVSFYDEKERERFLSPSELVRLNSLLAKESHQILADFLVLAINTGARKSDVLAMRWADIQWEREIWRVPFPKGGEAYDVALLPAAVEVLSRRRSEAADSAEFVFPSATAKSGHVEDVKKQWQAFRAKAKILDVRIHDLRRTCGSFIAMSGGSEVQIAAALGHRSLQSVKVYARLNDENVRQAREVGHQKMIELMALAEERAKAKPPQLPEVVGRKLGRP